MDATVKLTLGKDGCQHVTAEITIDGQTKRIVKTRDQWLEKEEESSIDKFAVVEANIAAYLKTDESAAAKDGKALAWDTAATAITAKRFKV